jgi:hypothetical protein
VSDPFAKTRYRIAQHWRFHNDTPEAKDTLVIIGVEDHPTQGIICDVHVEYDPPFPLGPSGYMSGGGFCVTQAALDRSVTELVAAKGPLRTARSGNSSANRPNSSSDSERNSPGSRRRRSRRSSRWGCGR